MQSRNYCASAMALMLGLLTIQATNSFAQEAVSLPSAIGGKTISVFSNRQKAGEVVVPQISTSINPDVATELKRSLLRSGLAGDAGRIDGGKSLMVTGLGTVNDKKRSFDPAQPDKGTKGGAWTFGTLMRGLANSKETKVDESEFARNWITAFLTKTTVVPGEEMQERPGISSIIADWERRSGVGPGGKLDVDMAPFRLLAIVNRIDLRDPAKLGNAGEGRFVFCAIDPSGQPLQFTVIFEYGVQLQPSNSALQVWAQKWIDLAKFKLPEQQEQYNAALQVLTDQFSNPGVAASLPNKSALNQLRTNEILNHKEWELREFVLDSGTKMLKPTTVKKTPQVKVQESPILGDFINENADAILNEGAHDVPPIFKGQGFGTGISPTPAGDNGLGWNAPNIESPKAEPSVRRNFSLNTCSGCHHRETNAKGTFFFTHIRPRLANSQSLLSVFLTGKDESGKPVVVKDPITDVNVFFNDLERRATFIDAIVTSPASALSAQKRLEMVH